VTTAFSLSATEMARSAKDRKRCKEELARELDSMSAVMVREKGLLNHSQGALLLDITPARLTELANRGKLTRYDFLGRTYVSVEEIKNRRAQDVKAGRPARTPIQRVAVGVQAALKTDAVQAAQGGFAGPYEKAKRRRKT
jgi:hypothetical protein